MALRRQCASCWRCSKQIHAAHEGHDHVKNSMSTFHTVHFVEHHFTISQFMVPCCMYTRTLLLSCPWLAMKFHIMMLPWETVLSIDTSQMGPAWAGFSKCLILEHFVFFLSFLVLIAENQKGDTVNLLDQREKRNLTLWIKLESHSFVSESNRDHYNSHEGLNTVKCTK